MIYKYELSSKVLLPEGSLVLKAGIQSGGMYIWALIDPKQPLIERNFEIVGTGHPFEYGCLTHRFVDTIFDGPFVWHIFEVNNK